MSVQDQHGGNIYAAGRELGILPSRLLDFSASINPFGPSQRALRLAADGLSLACHYPDPDCHDLVTALASRWNLEPANFVIGNGSAELIHLIPRALAIRHALVLGPAFSEYAQAVSTMGGRTTHLHANRENQYRHSVRHILETLRTSGNQVDSLFLCNPNNPTGQVLAAREVLNLAEEAAHTGIWVVVDEAYIEYCENQSVLSAVNSNPWLLILRSFTKFYALPGLRIGYLVGSQNTVAQIKHLQPTWSVNSIAQIAAHAALKDRRHARRSLAFVQRERARFEEALRALPGLVIFPSEANFLLLELPPPLRASAVSEALRRHGLLIRDCSSIPGLNERTIRVAIRTPRQNRRLVEALGPIVTA